MEKIEFKESEISHKSHKEGKLENISFWISLVTVSLSPIVFFHSNFSPIESIKYNFISYGIIISLILFLLSKFKNTNTFLPNSKISLSASIIVLSLLISTVFGQNPIRSFFGQSFEITTAGFLLVIIIAGFLFFNYLKTNSERILYLYSGILLSFTALFLFEFIRIITGPGFMNFGIFQSLSLLPIGKFSEFGIYSAIVFFISYFAYRLLDLSKINKIICSIVLVLSTISILIVDFPPLYYSVTILFALIVISDFFSTKNTSRTGLFEKFKKVTKLSIVALIFFAILSFKNDKIISPIVSSLDISNFEIALPWQYTVDIASHTLKQSPLFGVGPNRFINQYLRFKPQEINNTQFYNVDFSNGFGNIPSTVVTQGLFGIIAWFAFLILYIYFGYKKLSKENDNEFILFSKYSLFFSSIFLIILNVIFTPSHVIMLFTALLIASYLSFDKTTVEIKGNILKVISIISVIIAISWLGFLIKKSIALSYFNDGIQALNSGDETSLLKSKEYFSKALSYDNSDIYYQALSQNNIIEINSYMDKIQKTSDKANTEEIIKKISTLVDESLNYSRNAINIDPLNYYNYISEARISEIAVNLKIKNAYENAKNAYLNSTKISPMNPATYLSLARLELQQNKYDDALPYIGLSLQLKQNYIDAVFLLAQVQVRQGRTKDAITSVKYATQINPNDPTLFFQLGILYYNDKDYVNAIEALNQAIKLNNIYANAQYFLGLSYARIGNIKDSIINFENLEQTNPENEEVKLILRNLRAGKPIFADAMPPIDSKPEKRSTLPLIEKKVNSKKSVQTR